jgi:dihydroorotate dehydrogenase
MYVIIRKFLFLFDPEVAHHVAMFGLRILNKIGLLSVICNQHKLKPRTIFGIKFENPVGLAAGLDKNAEYIDIMAKLGFGFIEVGTLTPRAQPGNIKPRSFRLTKEKGIINRFGFNNVGIDRAIDNIKKSKYSGVIGINIGKNFNTPIEFAIEDYLIGFRKSYLYASYIAINISSPNTKGLRQLQGDEFFENLVKAIKSEQNKLNLYHNKYTPFLIKISPDAENSDLDNICKNILKYNRLKRCFYFPSFVNVGVFIPLRMTSEFFVHTESYKSIIIIITRSSPLLSNSIPSRFITRSCSRHCCSKFCFIS